MGGNAVADAVADGGLGKVLGRNHGRHLVADDHQHLGNIGDLRFGLVDDFIQHPFIEVVHALPLDWSVLWSSHPGDVGTGVSLTGEKTDGPFPLDDLPLFRPATPGRGFSARYPGAMRLRPAIDGQHGGTAARRPRLGPMADFPLPTSRGPWLRRDLATRNARISRAGRREKFAAMAGDAFSFLRGTNHLYWHDLGTAPALSRFGGGADTRIWIQGDMHANNLGSFAEAHGAVVYDANDFDEAVLGDYQMDLWRLAVSIVLIAHSHPDLAAVDAGECVAACADAYLETLHRWLDAAGDAVQVFTAANTYGQLDDFLERIAAEQSPAAMLARYTSVDRQGRRILDPALCPDLGRAPAAMAAELIRALPAYGLTLGGGLAYDPDHFSVLSIACRLHAGIGSLGVPRFYVLIAGGGDGPVILDVKAQPLPSAFVYGDPIARAATQAGCAEHQGCRVILGARALGHAADDYQGWLTCAGRQWSIRRRSPWKATLPVSLLNSRRRLEKMAKQWGQVLATCHCRADRWLERSGPGFAVGVAARTKGRRRAFRDQVVRVATTYAAQVEADFTAFRAWRG